MKNGKILPGIFLLLCMVSCFNEDDSPGYCYRIIHESPDSVKVSSDEFVTIKSLFVSNNLDISNYQFFSLEQDESGNYHIAAFPFVNGLKIIFGFVAFHFDRTGGLQSINGDTISGIALDTIPSTNPGSAIRIFLQELDRDQTYAHKIDTRYGCFDLEFGYYDLNGGDGTGIRNFIKVWIVTPRGGYFPYAIINDNTSELVRYFNGIIFN